LTFFQIKVTRKAGASPHQKWIREERVKKKIPAAPANADSQKRRGDVTKRGREIGAKKRNGFWGSLGERVAMVSTKAKKIEGPVQTAGDGPRKGVKVERTFRKRSKKEKEFWE